MQWGNVLIGALIVFVIASVGVWWQQGVVQTIPIPTVTTSAKQSLKNNTSTYKNETFGYIVEYQGGVKVHLYPTTNDGIVGFDVDDAIPVDGHFEDTLNSNSHRVHFGIGLSIAIDNPLPQKYASSTPCEWYYAERENIDVNGYDPSICTGHTNSPGFDGYPTTFAGEPAYVRIKNVNGIDGGLYASKQYDIVFFHNSRPWEISYSTPPDNPTDVWKRHPYYAYLEKSVPIVQQILSTFKFVQ